MTPNHFLELPIGLLQGTVCPSQPLFDGDDRLQEQQTLVLSVSSVQLGLPSLQLIVLDSELVQYFLLLPLLLLDRRYIYVDLVDRNLISSAGLHCRAFVRRHFRGLLIVIAAGVDNDGLLLGIAFLFLFLFDLLLLLQVLDNAV